MQKPQTPTYRRHRAGGRDRAFVELDGQRYYIGRYGSRESIQRYDQLVAEWLAAGRHRPGEAHEITVVEAARRYWHHCLAAFPPRTRGVHRVALRRLRRLYGRTRAVDFGPRSLRALRETWARESLARKTVNEYTAVIKAMFKWAASHELMPGSVHHGLATVEGLRRGRSAARETEPVRPVPPAHVRAVRHLVSRQVWAMIELQRLTGMRPGEVVQMRAVDLDMTARVWTYTPATHKTAHHGHSRTVYLGPRAQTILRPFLRPELAAQLFSPRDATADRAAVAKTHRRPGAPKAPSKTTRRIRDGYDVHSYRRAIERACLKAGVPEWAPNRLRHNAATRLRREFGIDLAQTILGHRIGSAITEIYAEANVGKAKAVVAKVG